MTLTVLFILYLLGVTVFLQSFRYSQRQKINVFAVSAVNYLVASLVSGMLWASSSNVFGGLTSGWALLGGFLNGSLFFLNLCVLLSLFKTAGVGIAQAVNSTGIVCAVVAAWFFWNESMGLYRWVAVALMPSAIFLMRPGQKEVGARTLKSDSALFLCFIMSGCIFIIHKWMQQVVVPNAYLFYPFILFLSAWLINHGYIFLNGHKIGRQEWLIGAVAGFGNVIAVQALVQCIAMLPAVIFYPMSACLLIVINTIIPWLLWKEKLLARQLIGLGVSAAVILLTNIS